MANDAKATLQKLSQVEGFIAAALVDADSGMPIGTIGGTENFDIEVAAATNTNVVKSKMRAVQALDLDDTIEDILISLGSQYHLIRPLKGRPHIFFYLALHRDRSNLGMARLTVADAEKDLKL